MNKYEVRILSMLLAACLILCHAVSAFGLEPDEESRLPVAISATEAVDSSALPAATSAGLPEPPEPDDKDDSAAATLPATPTKPPESEQEEANGSPSTPADLTEAPLKDESESSLGLSAALAATASDPKATALTAEELKAFIDSGEPEIWLAGDIVFTADSTAISFEAPGPVRVYMGDYSIVLEDDAYLSTYGKITFIGSAAPMFRVGKEAALLNGSEVSITAAGPGAVALRMAEGAVVSVPMLRAEGEDAIALAAEGGERFHSLTVTASGEGSAAIDAGGDLTLTLCKIEGAIRCEGTLTLDCTSADPLPSNAAVIKRKAIWQNPVGFYDIAVFGLHRLIGSSDPLPESITMTLYQPENPDEYVNAEATFPVLWDMNSADLSVPGETIVTAVPQIESIPGLESIGSTEIKLHTVEPGIPHLTGALAFTFFGAASTELYLFEPIEDADEILLFHSPDGENWTALAEFEDYSFSGDHCMVYSVETKKTHHYKLEVIGGVMAGESNVLSFYLDENGQPFPGGDRTGTDRPGHEPPDGDDEKPPDNGDEPSGDDGDESGNIGRPGRVSGSRTGGGSGNDVVLPVRTEKPPIQTTVQETIPVLETMTEDLPAPTLSVVDEPQSADTQAADIRQESAAPQAKAVQPPISETSVADVPVVDTPLSPDPEQTAPKPGFPVSAATIFFLIVAVLSSGALLVLRLAGRGRWRHGK
jgi:hypothetical protein